MLEKNIARQLAFRTKLNTEKTFCAAAPSLGMSAGYAVPCQPFQLQPIHEKMTGGLVTTKIKRLDKISK